MKKLSIILGTYNRSALLSNLMSSILSDRFMEALDFELIVCDDCSKDNTSDIVASFDDSRLRYIRSETNVGAFKNFKNGIDSAAGQYIVKIGDDDNIGDASFYADAVRLLDKGVADLVFGRLCAFDEGGGDREILQFPFKNLYTPDEFLRDWIGSIDAICDSCFVYKKEVLQNAYPKGYVQGNTLDYFIIYKNIKESRKIAFVDKVAYNWRRSTPTSLSGSDFDNATKLAMNTLAFAFEAFLEQDSFDNNFFNKVVLNSIAQVESNFYISQMENIFKDFYAKFSDVLNSKKIYIYGYGEVGKKFEIFLLSKGIKIKAFADDFRHNDMTVCVDEAANDIDSVIVICTFKHKLGIAMYKKLIGSKAAVLDFFDLLKV